MLNLKIFPVFLLTASILLSYPVLAQITPIQFSEEEKEWIAQNPVITMCVDPDWYPFEQITPEGEYVGIAADLLGIISKRAGITLLVIPTKNWQQSIEYSLTGKCDILSFLNQSPERDNWLIFTAPYLIEHNVFITREEHPYIADPSALEGKTIVLPTGTSIEERVRENYPNLEIILVNSETEAFRMVNDRKADITLRSLSMAAYTIKKEGWFNLKITGQLHQFSNKLRMGVSKDLPIVRDILDKAIASITPFELQEAVNNHVMFELVAPYNYGLILILILAIVVIVVLGLLWNNQLRRLNARLEEKKNKLLKLFREQSKDIAYRKGIEAQLRANQQQLSGMISSLPGFVYRCIYDDQYTMKFISDGCEEITGYKPVEFADNRSISFASLIHPDDRETIQNTWKESLQNKTHFQLEYRIIHRNGSLRTIWERGHGIYSDDDDELLYLDGFISDITQSKKDQQALIDSERKYRLITANTSDVIWVINLSHGRFTFISPSVYHLRGFTIEEALDQRLEDSMTPESMKIVTSKIADGIKRITENPNSTFEHEITEIQQPCKNGDIIWVEVATLMQLNEQGEMEITGVSRNIELRKRMEEAILYKNRMQQLVATISTEFNSANQTNINKKLYNALKLAGDFFEMDRAYIFRYSRDNTLYCLTHEWCADGVQPSYEINQNMAFADSPWWNEQIKENEPIYIPSIHDLPPEAIWEKAEFTQQNIQTLICFPVMINGLLSGLVGFDAVKKPVAITSEQMLSMQLTTNIISDTLERIKAETARDESVKISRETAARYQAFIDASDTGAWEYNKDTGYLWCSKQYFEMLGYNHNDFDSATRSNASAIWEELIHPDDYNKTFAYLQDFLKSPQGTYEQIFRMKHANQSDVWILSRGRNLIDHTGKQGDVIVGTHIDITEQKKAEETILIKNKELESFLYVASHDLRSPLINIQGFGMRIQTQMDKIKNHLATTGIDNEALEEIKKSFLDVIPRSLGIIFSNVNKMNDLINGLLAISRTGRVKMTISSCNMDELMERILKSHWFQLEEAKVNIHIGLLPPCYGDENILSQLFSNLLDNAIKYKKPDHPLQLKIEGNRVNSTVVYSISDNGLGISERNQLKIWDVFYRVDPTSPLKGEGIGLNLASTIVEKHKGKIWVKSVEGEGSTFFVQLSGVAFRE